MLKRFLKLLLILMLILPVYSIEEPKCGCEHHHHNIKPIEIKEGSNLDIKDCIMLGIQNSPVIKEYAHKLEIAKSNVGIAKSAYFPELSIGVGFRQELNSNNEDFVRNYRELPTVGAALNQMIWDFGKTTSYVKMEKFLEIASEYEFNDIVCFSIFQIKMKYYSVLRAEAYLKAVEAEYNLEHKLLSELKKMNRDKADLADIKSKIGLTKFNLINAKLDYENATEELNNALYIDNPPNYSIYQTQTFIYEPVEQEIYKNITPKLSEDIKKDETIFEHPKYSVNEAVKIAYNNSPDLKALYATRDAMEEGYNAARKNYYPELNWGIGYDYIRSNQYRNNGMSVGVNLGSNINSMYQKYNTKGAKAQLDLADTEIITFKKNLYYTVRKCLNEVKAKYNSIEIAKEQMSTSKEFFELTYDRYMNDEVTQNDLQASIDTYADSLRDHVNSQYEYNIALIKLEMAMHEHLIDYHDDAHHAAEFHEGDENSALSKMINCGKKHKN